MFKDIMYFVTYFISAVILLTTSFILFRLTPPLVIYGGEVGDYLTMQQLPQFFLPVTSLVLSVVLFAQARKAYQKLS